MIGYIIISVLYVAIFAAFMQVNRDNSKYWDIYQYSDPSWKIEYIMLCVIGFFIWPLVVLFIIFNRLAFKILKKNKK